MLNLTKHRSGENKPAGVRKKKLAAARKAGKLTLPDGTPIKR